MQIHISDNVEVRSDGQKYALIPIKKDENVIKYGFPIGHAKRDIAVGEMVSPENLASNLSGITDWVYSPYNEPEIDKKSGFFSGYKRANGDVGIRNDIWIIPTVGCANSAAKKLAELTGARAYTHPYGCSQLGGDLETTQKVLSGLIKHPNAGGVLVIGLGCENNEIHLMKAALGDYDKSRIRFLILQDCEDEIAEGLKIINELKAITEADIRTEIPISALRIGVKCGGSDGYSGITANPLVGLVADEFFKYDAKILMTEMPEAFGAEQILLERSDGKESFNAASNMLKGFRQYFIDHGEGVADNPSPGNIAGGISTLEEKSLGCVQKAGKVTLRGALNFGEAPNGKGGLYLVNGPGNDQVAVTNLAASGAHIILFTTGRGTPLCGPVPTLKIATNTPLFNKKPHWMDFNAGEIINGADKAALTSDLFDLIIKTAEGKESLGEKNGYEDIAIFKDGVTL